MSSEIEKNETPQQKAQRLNVPLYRKLPDFPKLDAPPKKDYELMKHLMETVIGVCENCNKEITRGMGKRPCVISGCPFGTLSN